MRNIIMLVIISLFAYADWETDVNQIEGYLYMSPFFHNQDINNQIYGLGWKSFSTESVVNSKSIYDGNEYYWDDSMELGTNAIKYRNPYVNDDNLAWNFDLEYSRDNSSYYMGKTDAYYASGSRQYQNSIPDQYFLNYPNMGNVFGAMTTYADNDGFGISNIQQSSRTSIVRNRVATIRDTLEGMQNSSNVNDYTFSWDLSAIGQVLVDRQVCLSNPFLNLRGGFRVKPMPGDYLYSFWNSYFNKDNAFGNNLRHALLFLAYGLAIVYVINDLMAIIGA